MLPNRPPVFEALPAEVLGNILRQVASPEDLYSTIRASPSAFGSFHWFREAILIEVLQAHLPAEIFAEYLGLLHIPKYEDFNHIPNRSEFEYHLEEVSGRTGSRMNAWERCRHAAWANVLCGFFETHFEYVNAARSCNIQRYGALRPADKHHINHVMSIYGMLRRLIRDYQSFVRSILTGSPPPLSDLEPSFRRHEVHSPQGWPPLCENESMRLQRAFLRYELCSRSSAIPMWKSHIVQWVYIPFYDDEDFKHSVSRYIPCWEEEEIRCVWTYVLRQYQVLVREVVAEFRCDVRRLSRRARYAPDNEVITAPRISNETSCRFFEEWTYNMSCIGLPMLQQLLRSDFDDQRRFLKNTTVEMQPMLEDALFLNDWSSLRDLWRHQESLDNPRTASSPSPIYTSIITELARRSRAGNRDTDILNTVETELKEIGWVFWENRERLDFFSLPDPDTDSVDGIKAYITRLTLRHPSTKFEVEESFPEQSMYVTKQDYEGELSEKYAVGSPTPGGEHFFVGRLRSISDGPSKQASTAFQEICWGLATSR